MQYKLLMRLLNTNALIEWHLGISNIRIVDVPALGAHGPRALHAELGTQGASVGSRWAALPAVVRVASAFMHRLASNVYAQLSLN